MRKFLLLIALMISGVGLINAQSVGDAVVIDYDDGYYSLYFSVTSVEPAECEITGYSGSPTDIIIPTTVTFGETEFAVISIGGSAFSSCSSLTSISFGDNSQLASIGNTAFQNCYSLTSINIPIGVTSIDSNTFSLCSSLTSIEIPNTVASIGDYAFEGCSNLMRLYCYAENVPETASTAFEDCPYDMTIYVPTVANYNTSPWSKYYIVELPSINATTTIDYGDYSLTFKVIEGYQCEVSCSKEPTVPTSITIPATVEINGVECSVTSIGESAFYGCSSLTSVEIPSSVKEIVSGSTTYVPHNGAFGYCSNLASISFGESSQLTSIGIYAFENCSSLTNIEIPSGVTSIESYAFENCSSLTNIEIPSGVTSIESYAFGSCSSLTSIEIPNSVTSIGRGAFQGCSSLTNIEIPSGVTSIKSYAFGNCSSLTSIEIPCSVTSIGDDAFYGCSKLKFIRCHAEVVPAIERFSFRDCSIKNIQVSETSVEAYKAANYWKNYNITKIYPYFVGEELIVDYEEGYSMKFTTLEDYGCSVICDTKPSSPTEIIIPDAVTFDKTKVTVTIIGNNAFESCSSLTSIEMPSCITSIGNDAFYECSNLADVNFGEDSKLTSIGYGAFYNCSSLTSIEVPSRVKEIISGNHGFYKYGCFESCSNLTSVIFGENSQLTSIGNYAFSSCSSLTSVNFGNNSQLTSIGDYAFYQCSKLTSIEIPSGVTSIGGSAFSSCSRLKSIRCLPENVPSTGSAVFDYVPSDMHIQVPENSIEIYKSTEPWSKYTITKIYPYHYGEYVVKEYEGYSLRFTVNPVYDGATVKCEVKPNSSTAIVIPSTIVINEKEFDVTAIESSAFYQCSSLTSIEIPSSVKEIIGGTHDSSTTTDKRYGSFESCSNLVSVIFGENSQLTSIGNYAFSSCSALTNIEIPNSVTSIGNYAFSSCSSLKSIRCLPENVPSTGSAVFDYVPSDMHIQVPENSIELYKSTEPWSKYTITKIYPYHYGEYVVKEYEGYSLRFTMNPVYDGATVKCEVKPNSSTAIVIPSTIVINEKEFDVTAIEASAFYQCSNLISIEIPSTVKEIIGGTHNSSTTTDKRYGSFESCSNLTSVIFGENSQLTSIGDYAFYQCSKLTSIEIPSGVTSIGDYAFYYCSNLERLMFAKDSKLNTIGNYAFNNCSSLTSVEIPSTVTTIGGSAFYNCSNILKFAFEENSQLTSIGNYAFSSCSALTNIEIPNTVTSISDNAFYSCSSLTSVTFGDNSQLTSIGNSAFSSCSGLTSINFGDNSQLTSIGHSTFYQCSSLTSINFGDNSQLTSIDDDAFRSTFSSSAVIEIPSSVTSIGNSAFASASMSGISFGENSQLTSISNSAFKGCYYLTNIVIPKNVTEIRNFAFQNCSKLQSVTFEEGSQLKTISDLSFKACTLLQFVEIPSNVNYVGYESFADCKNLTMIENYAVEVPQTDSDAFKSCPERMRIQVPAESLEDYQAETPWNKFTLVTEIVQHEITASPNINNAGTIQGAGTYFLNEIVTLKAKASSSKYKFAYWSEDGKFVSDEAEYSFVVESDRNLVANFMNDNYWKPNSGMSSHNMIVTADVQVEGVSANNINIEIGAFCGNELRGNARIQYFEAVDKFLYQIVVYGENNDQITFKLYDHNTKQVLDYLTQASLTFTEDATFGSIDEPMAINFTQKPMYEIVVTCNIEDACSVTGGGLYSEGEQATITANQVEGLLFQNWTLNNEVVSTNRSYTFVVTEAQEYVANYVYAHNRHLNKGWNWYSTYMQLSGEEGLNTVQTALGSAASQMKSQTAFDTYEQGEWIGGLEEYSTEKMYMMNVVNNNGYDLTIIGTPVNPSDYTIELAPNWNWIGYPMNTNMSINDALSGITPKHGDYVKSQTDFSQYYDGSGWLGALQTLEIGKGYMYQNTSDETIELVYSNEVSRSELKANRSNENNHWITEIGKYPTNMNIIAIVNDADTDFEIGAFCDGECRGSARTIYIEQLDKYMIFLTVYGEGEETISFKYYDVVSEDVLSLTNEIKYSVNATIGTIDNPYVMNFATIGIEENNTNVIGIYPNPVNVNSEIYLETECDNVEIYNALGVKIAEYENVSMIDGIETSGIYVIKIVEQGNVKFSRLVVK